jgi:hypothetical protein
MLAHVGSFADGPLKDNELLIRCLVWPGQFFELLWLTDAAEASANPLRLDSRADWASTGASPFGVAFRGQIEPARRDDFWLYDTLGPRIWIHRDDERFPQRPLVLALEADEEQMEQRRQRGAIAGTVAHRQPGELHELRLHGPSKPSLPAFAGPQIVYEPGPHLLELVIGAADCVVSVSDCLLIRR